MSSWGRFWQGVMDLHRRRMHERVRQDRRRVVHRYGALWALINQVMVEDDGERWSEVHTVRWLHALRLRWAMEDWQGWIDRGKDR